MKPTYNPLTGKFDYIVSNLLEIGTRNHNDLQNRDAADAHPEASITKTTYADATLSGAPIIVKVDIGGTPYYFKAYPTKA